MEAKNHELNLQPFFSVIIATYNRSRLLIRALDSLIAQTDKNWEAIIIDDGSTDNTLEAVQDYLKWNSKIKYIQQESTGATSSKNKGLFLAKCKFITFLDSDDEYVPTHLESRKVILQKYPEIDLLHGGVKVIGNTYVPNRFDYTKSIHLSQCAIGGTFFIKRKLALKLKGFRKMPLGSDSDFLERATKAGTQIIKTNLPTYIYNRDIQNSITHNFMAHQNCQSDEAPFALIRGAAYN